MKLKFLYAAFAAFALAACSEKITHDSPASSEELVSLVVNVGDDLTKAPNTTESDVKYVQLFVFNTYKKLETTKRFTVGSSAATSFSIDVMKGTKTVHAIVNAPEEITGVISYSDLCKKTSDLKDNTRASLIMEGWKTVTVSSSVSSVTIPAKRIAAKISIVSIENKLAGAYSGKSIVFRKAYLTNVAGNRNYLAEGYNANSPTTWYNKMAMTDPNANPAKSLTNFEVNVSIEHDKARTYREDFYCYPNPTKNDSFEGSWTARYTRLVFEMSIDNEIYYYPVTIPSVEQNTCYEVSLVVTKPGSLNPDLPCDKQSLSTVIDVVKWTDGADRNETI